MWAAASWGPSTAGLKTLLGLDKQERLRLHSVVALGYPAHKSHLVPVQENDVRYYLDEIAITAFPNGRCRTILLGEFLRGFAGGSAEKTARFFVWFRQNNVWEL